MAASRLRFLFLVLSALGAFAGCKTEPPGPGPGAPATIRLVEGTVLSGVAGAELPAPLVVEVVDAAGKPVPNQIVNFRVVSGGGSVFAGTGLTNGAGRVQERWTLGPRVGDSQVLEARAVDNDTGASLVFATFSATARPDAPASMPIVSGDGQIGQARTALANPLVLAVADQYGNPVPGVSVAWTVEDGGGSLEASTTTTDESGRASNRWTLGPVATTQHVRAEAGSLIARFSTAGVGGIPATLRKAFGDQQSALQGTAILLPPTVKVADTLGSPVAGVVVQFAVTAGGGTIVQSSATTDGVGLASCGGWTLGDSPGANAMTASSQGLSSVVFSATATDAISISGAVSPGPSNLVGDAFVVFALVTSASPITSVVGSIGGTSVPFTYSTVRNCHTRIGCVLTFAWNGTLSGVGMSGPATVTLTARDSLGHQASSSVAVVVDRPPVVMVTLPAPDHLARPGIEVAASCIDDSPAGCGSLTLLAGPPDASEADCIAGDPSYSSPVAVGTTTLAQPVDLSASEGGTVHLCFVGTDAAGQKTGAFRRVHVESSPKLAVVTTVPGGWVLDVAGARTLYLEGAANTYTIRIQDSDTGITQDLGTHTLGGPYPRNSWIWNGYLTPHGALYEISEPDTYDYVLYEWRDGAESMIGPLNSFVFKVSGGFALTDERRRGLVRRDLLADTFAVVGTNTVDGDVAPNGDVVYVGGTWGEVFRFRDGTTTKISTDPVGVFAENSLPRTDGATVAYVKHGLLAIFDGTTEVLLPGIVYESVQPMVAGGWVVHQAYSSSNELEIRRHGPGGDELVLTGDPFPLQLAPDGTVIFRNQGRMLRSTPGAAPTDIAGAWEPVIYRDGRFLVLIGASVLEVLP